MKFNIEYIGTPNLRFSLNGKTFQPDENGYVLISSQEIFDTNESKGLYEFDRIIDEVLTKTQKINFYQLLTKSRQVNRIGVRDIVAVCDIEKSIVRNQIIPLAMKHGLLLKYETQWRPNKELHDHIQILVKSLQINPQLESSQMQPKTIVSQVLTELPGSLKRKRSVSVSKKGK